VKLISCSKVPISPANHPPGTPQKAMQSEGYNTEVSETLVQFDLKFDSLRTFLESITKVVNQHASMLNKLNTDVGARVALDTVSLFSIVMVDDRYL
jgi:hypothetical protein